MAKATITTSQIKNLGRALGNLLDREVFFDHPDKMFTGRKVTISGDKLGENSDAMDNNLVAGRPNVIWNKHLEVFNGRVFTGSAGTSAWTGGANGAEVWMSDLNGENFTKVLTISGKPAVWDLMVHNNALYALVPCDPLQVYRTFDGVNWSQVFSVATAAGYGNPYGKAMISFGDKLYVFTSAGYHWSQSGDPGTWTSRVMDFGSDIGTSQVYSRAKLGNSVFIGTAGSNPAVY